MCGDDRVRERVEGNTVATGDIISLLVVSCTSAFRSHNCLASLTPFGMVFYPTSSYKTWYFGYYKVNAATELLRICDHLYV